MNKYLAVTAALLFVVMPNLQAGELLAEPVPAAYVAVSFGGGAKATSSYGLQLARFQSDEQQGGMLFDATRPAYLDVKFSQRELTGFSLNGTDMVALAKLHGYNANGESSFQQWWGGLSDNQKAFFVVAGIGVTGCLLDWCRSGGGGGSPRRQP